MDLKYTSIRISCSCSSLLFVLQLDFDDLHAVDVRVIPGRHVDTVNAGEVHPVRALGLPVHGPGVASQYVPDGGPQLLSASQPLEPGHIQLSELGLSSAGEYHIEVITRVSDPLRHPDTDII